MSRTRYKLEDDDMNGVLSSLNDEIEQLSKSLEDNVAFQELQDHRQRTPPPRQQQQQSERNPAGSVDYSSLLEGEDFVSGSYEDESVTRSHKDQQQQRYSQREQKPPAKQYYHEVQHSRSQHQQPHQNYRISTVGDASTENSVVGPPPQSTNTPYDDRRKLAPSGSTSASTRPTQSLTESFSSPSVVAPPKSSQRDSSNEYPPATRNHGYNSVHRTDGGEGSLPHEPPGVISPPFRMFSPSPTRKPAPSSASRTTYHPNTNRRPHDTPSPTAYTDRTPVAGTPVPASAAGSGRNYRHKSTTSSSTNRRPVMVPKRASEWRPMLESVQWTLQEKEERIAALEQENEDLYAQVQHLQQQRLEESALLEERRHQQQEQQQDLETKLQRLQQQLDAVREQQQQQQQQHTPQRRFHPTPSSGSEPYSGRRHPPGSAATARRTTPDHPYSHDKTLLFSPGTHFVAELAARTDVAVGHHAHLSFIIDEYWDEFVAQHGTGEGTS